jgi:hypothetical protein
MADLLLPRIREAFRALATTFVPEAARLDDAGWAEVETVIEEALASRPEAMRRQLALLIRILTWLPLFTRLRSFTALDAAQRAAFLHALERSPLALLRRGTWGLRTLVFMGYYGRPSAGAAIGWHGDARGWASRTPAARRSGGFRPERVP